MTFVFANHNTTTDMADASEPLWCYCKDNSNTSEMIGCDNDAVRFHSDVIV